MVEMTLSFGYLQGFVKHCDFYFFIEVLPAKRHGESSTTISQLSLKITKVSLLLQNLDCNKVLFYLN